MIALFVVKGVLTNCGRISRRHTAIIDFEEKNNLALSLINEPSVSVERILHLNGR